MKNDAPSGHKNTWKKLRPLAPYLVLVYQSSRKHRCLVPAPSRSRPNLPQQSQQRTATQTGHK